MPQSRRTAVKEAQAHPRQPSEYDNFRSAKDLATQGGAKNQVFNNNEGHLPAASNNETYYEYDLGADGFGGAGQHRAVLLVLTGGDKRKVLNSYFTKDHYKTFCLI